MYCCSSLAAVPPSLLFSRRLIVHTGSSSHNHQVQQKYTGLSPTHLQMVDIVPAVTPSGGSWPFLFDDNTDSSVCCSQGYRSLPNRPPAAPAIAAAFADPLPGLQAPSRTLPPPGPSLNFCRRIPHPEPSPLPLATPSLWTTHRLP